MIFHLALCTQNMVGLDLHFCVCIIHCIIIKQANYFQQGKILMIHAHNIF